ncbi:hypothetical protein B0H19DRAFT_1085334 [Mycena capillaripes]|nr:hypothetical protein B0H19DRAFT_1085334 [Mycena capillaripes]
MVSASEDEPATHMNYPTDIDWPDVNALFDNSRDSDPFLASVNPSILAFGGYANADGEVDDGLGYFGPSYAPPAPLYVNINHYAFNRLSQELSPLPPLPASDPSHDELDDGDVDAAAGDDQPVSPQDIDLELNERNILAGKRKRTKSTRAVDSTAAGPSK